MIGCQNWSQRSIAKHATTRNAAWKVQKYIIQGLNDKRLSNNTKMVGWI